MGVVAVASSVESDAAEPWAVLVRGNRRTTSRSPGAVSVAPVRPLPTRPAPAPLPVGRAVAGPHVRLPASVYHRRRAVAAGLVLGVVLVLWAALGVLGGDPLLVPERPDPAGSRLTPGAVYVVQPGDTLWSVAVRLRPDDDPRPVVDRLVASHGSTTLYVGERLRLPV